MKNLSIGSWAACLLLVFLTFPLFQAYATTDYPLIIEVQIAGEKSSDDFVKIYNPTSSDIYLGTFQGSYLRLVKRTKTGTKDYTIKSWSRDKEAKIPAQGYFIWANKDYTTLSDVNTFTSQTISVNNGIALRLGPENTGQIIDAVGWGDFNNLLFEKNSFSKNPVAQQKLARKQNSGIYQDSNDNSQDFYLNPEESPLAETKTEEKNGTKQTNETSSLVASPIEENESTGKQDNSQSPPPASFPSGVIISEILPAPSGPDEKEEWIELFNQNNFAVELSGWKISDSKGKSTIYIFPQESKIEPQGFLVLNRQTTKIVLNNDGDEISLNWPNGKITDKASYEKAPAGQSYNFLNSQWQWSSALTPGKVNFLNQGIEEEEKDENLREDERSKESLESQKEELAAAAKQMSSRTFPVLIVALIVAVLSGIIILFLKHKIKQKIL